MANRHGPLQTDIIVPAALVIVALLTSLEPTIFGVAISDRQIVLGLVAFLGVDALIERTGRLHRIEQSLTALTQQVAGPVPAGRVLRGRSSFERMNSLVGHARASVLIIGINLEGAVAALTALMELAEAGGQVRLIAMDPKGAAIEPSAAMAGVDPGIRRAKITQNLDLLTDTLTARLSAAARSRVTVQVVDRILPLGVVGIDLAERDGRLIVQHYLTQVPAEKAPLLDLRRDTDGDWFQVYLAQSQASAADATEW